MKLSTIFNAIIPIFVFGTVITASSCKKNEPAKAQITVVDIDGNRVKGATVYLNCTPVAENQCILSDTQTTDDAGQTQHTFEHPAIYGSDDINFAVLQVQAFVTIDSTYMIIKPNALGGLDTLPRDSFYRLVGETFIELKVDQVAEETVTLVRE